MNILAQSGGRGTTPGGIPDYTITNPAVNPSVGTGEGGAILKLFLVNFLSIGFGIAGLLAFVVLLIGGLQYIVAGSDKDAVDHARKRITNGLIGLAIVLSVFAIIKLAEALFGLSLLKFTIPTIQ